MPKNLQRILRDKKNLIINPLTSHGIIVLHDDEDIMISRACIIGPKDTPYEGGFYFFEFRFPDKYPYEPFKVKFFTNNGITRMHPNFYTCGKVCVSIIGTWSGPGWTSCQNLESVLLTFQSLFIANPLHQEPGFENEPIKGSKNKNYNNILKHENINIAIVKMLEYIPPGFEKFHPLLLEYLHINRDDILSKCDSSIKDNTILDSPRLWNFKVKIEYKKLYKKLISLLEDHKPQDVENIVDNIKKVDNLKCKELLKIISEEEQYKDQDPNIVVQLLLLQNKISIRDNLVKIIE